MRIRVYIYMRFLERPKPRKPDITMHKTLKPLNFTADTPKSQCTKPKKEHPERLKAPPEKPP